MSEQLFFFFKFPFSEIFYRRVSWVHLRDATCKRVSKRSDFFPRNSKFRVQKSLLDLLKDTKFAADIPNIAEQFDKTTKPRFVNADENQFIKFGGLRDKAP